MKSQISGNNRPRKVKKKKGKKVKSDMKKTEIKREKDLIKYELNIDFQIRNKNKTYNTNNKNKKI